MTGVIIIIVSGMKACLVPVVGGRGEGWGCSQKHSTCAKDILFVSGMPYVSEHFAEVTVDQAFRTRRAQPCLTREGSSQMLQLTRDKRTAAWECVHILQCCFSIGFVLLV